MKRVKAAPGAKRLIDSLRNMGYDCSTAIADLVDNSIAAQASEVYIEIRAQHGSEPASIIITDNGHGMDRDQLVEAMRFGAYQDYSADDLGKYGLGLKTASLSQCRTLTASSKAKASNGHKPRRCFARWDLDHVDQTDEWELLLPTFEELEDWEQQTIEHETCQDHGTVVIWTGLEEALPSLSSHDIRHRERSLAKLIEETADHLRMVFHRFMQGLAPRRRRLRLYLNGEELKPWDPFCRTESTRELDILTLPVNSINNRKEPITQRVTIHPFILPREDEFSNQAAWREASGPRNWNQQQGFYFYRNDRLLQAGGWSWLRAVDEHIKLLRVAVFFPRELDRDFSINITKMRARIPAEIRERVGGAVSKWAKTARERYDRKPQKSSTTSATPKPLPSTRAVSPKRSDTTPAINIGPLSFSLSNAPHQSLTVVEGSAPSQIRVIVPHSHELAEIFSLSSDSSDSRKRLCLAMMSFLEALYEKRMKPEAIPIQALRRALSRLK